MTRTPKGEKSSSTRSNLVTSIATWLTLVLTVFTLNLTLLGYGYDLAYLDTIGLAPEDLQRTPLDFLLRSWRPFITIIDNVGKFWTFDYQLTLWDKFFQENALILAVISLATAALAYVLQQKRKLVQLINFVVISSENFIHRRFPKLRQGLQYIAARQTSLKEFLKKDKNTRLFGYSGSFISLAFIVFYQIGMVLAWFVLVIGALLIAFVPFLGAASGTKRAKNEVLDPVGCATLAKPSGVDVSRLANCVRVLRDGKEVASGYQIDFSATRIFIFQPCVNRIVSFPLANSTVEQIERIEYEVREEKCESFIAYRKSIAFRENSAIKSD